MHLRRLRLSLLLLLLLPALGHAQPNLEDRYRLLAVPAPDAGRLEVVEFFSYASASNRELDALLQEWQKDQLPGLVFRRVPVARRDNKLPAAILYYTLEKLRLLDRLHDEVYRAYQSGEIDFDDDKTIADWAEKMGINPMVFMDVYRSPAMYSKAIVAKKLTIDYDVRSEPTLVIAGIVLTSADLVNDMPELVAVLDQLIEMVRTDHTLFRSYRRSPLASP